MERVCKGEASEPNRVVPVQVQGQKVRGSDVVSFLAPSHPQQMDEVRLLRAGPLQMFDLLAGVVDDYRRIQEIQEVSR